MQSVVDAQLIGEADEFAFRFTCEACSNFDGERLSCGNGFPTEPHRAVDLRRCRSLEFCKDFELG